MYNIYSWWSYTRLFAIGLNLLSWEKVKCIGQLFFTEYGHFTHRCKPGNHKMIDHIHVWILSFPSQLQLPEQIIEIGNNMQRISTLQINCQTFNNHLRPTYMCLNIGESAHLTPLPHKHICKRKTYLENPSGATLQFNPNFDMVHTSPLIPHNTYSLNICKDVS